MAETDYQLILAGNLRRIRERKGMRQEDVAAMARSQGLEWTQATIAAIEIGRRQVSLGEALLLQGTLAVRLAELLGTDAEIIVVQGARVRNKPWTRLTEGKPVMAAEAAAFQTAIAQMFEYRTREDVALARRYGVAEERLFEAYDASFGAAERKAAARLGVEPLVLCMASVALWGHGLTEERDKRFPNVIRGEDLRASRGHVTRLLMKDLKDLIDRTERRRRRR